jgi:hypothetical protein
MLRLSYEPEEASMYEPKAMSLDELETTRAGAAFAPIRDPSVFSQVAGNRSCSSQARARLGGGGSNPAYVVLFRHCDEGYTCPVAPSYKGCRGCEYLKQDSCATNNCNGVGIPRAYGYGKWLSCFAARTGVGVAAIFSQNPSGKQTNARPMTTASMLYDSLLRLAGAPPNSLCWAMFDRTAGSSVTNNPMVSALHAPIYANKTVAIVWDHGNIQYVLRALGVNLGSWWWNGCCYDQAVVVNMKTRAMATYALNTFGGNDPCAGTAVCQAASGAFPGCPGPWPVPFGKSETFGGPEQAQRPAKECRATQCGPTAKPSRTHIELHQTGELNDLSLGGLRI